MAKKMPKSHYQSGPVPRRFEWCATVEELREALAGLPGDLPLSNGGIGIKPVWYNVGHDEVGHEEHLGFIDDEADDWGDEDAEES